MRVSSLARGGALLLILAAPLAAQRQGGRAFTPEDWYRLTWVGSPALSPDGKLVAFTVTTIDTAKNSRHSEIWLQAVAGGEPRRLTAPAFESSNPRWARDGRTLLFTSDRPGGARNNTWAIRIDQGGEAFVPDSALAAPEPAQAAGPRNGAFTVTARAPRAAQGQGGRQGGAQPGGAQRPGGGAARGADSAAARHAAMPPMSRPAPNAITRPLDPARFDGFHITDTRYKANGTGWIPSTGRAQGPGGGSGGGQGGAGSAPAQLFLARPGKDTVQLTSTAYSHRSPTVSPDGKWIIFSADAGLRPDSVVTAERDSIAKLPHDRARDEADRNDSDLYILSVADCEKGQQNCRPRRIEHSGAESNVIWSPDSRRIAFVSRPSRYRASRLFVAPADGGSAPVDVQGDWQYEATGLEWQDANTIRFRATTGGASGIHQVDLRSRRVTPVLAGRRQISGIQIDSAKSRIVYVATSQDRPTELFVSDIDGGNERQLTSFNAKLNGEIAWSSSERFTYRSVDDLEIEAWLMKPHGYEEGKKYPMVVYIHGGPHSAYGEQWFDEFQNLAGAGMFVLFTNPRGSSGTNASFTHASRGDWGGKDYLDIMKAVDIVAQRPDVDSTRMGVTGGSYGGFMTAWITTKTDRFKAAQADRMISDWTSWWGTSDAQSLTNDEFFGRPWENQAMYDSLSPIRFVKNVRTPTLIVQSEEDHRTPMVGAEMWYMSLKTLNVPAEFIRYPRSNHDLSRTGEPWLLVDRLGRLRQWFSHWLSEGGPPATASTGSRVD